MIHNLKNLLCNNAPIKIISCILGISIWALSSSLRVSQETISVPVCFYAVQQGDTIQAPESISITLSGKRDDLQLLDKEKIALHIDAQQLHEGRQLLAIREEHLLLPEHIKIVHYNPLNLIVQKTSSHTVEPTIT